MENKVSRGSSRTTKKPKVPKNALDDKDLPHILWWKEVGPSTLFCFWLKQKLLFMNFVGLFIKSYLQ